MAQPVRLPDPPDNDNEVRVGARIREQRKLRGWRLRDVAEATGLSESLLSKIENDKSTPSLGGLSRIARVLGTNISAFFAGPHDKASIVAHQGQRRTIRSGEERMIYEELAPPGQGALLQSMLVTIAPGGSSSESRTHQGEETGYVVEGELDLHVDGQTYRLGAGDSFLFRSDLLHGYANPGREPTRVVWVNTPRTF